jgi:hypothetical protein
MASKYPLAPFKLEVKLEERPDGGLRARCEKVPGFLLSHKNPQKVLEDIEPALETILSEMFGVRMRVARLRELEEVADAQLSMPAHLCGFQSYVGLTDRQ